MNNTKTFFKPHYPFRVRLFSTGVPLLFFISVIVAASSPVRVSNLYWLSALLLGLVTSLLPFFIIRQILFLNEMVVRRHFLPDYFIRHTDLSGISRDVIQAGSKGIRIGRLLNAEELSALVQRWSASQTLRSASGVPAHSTAPFPIRGYGSYASFWGLIFGVIAMFLSPPAPAYDPRWILGGTFLFVYLLYIYVVPKLI